MTKGEWECNVKVEAIFPFSFPLPSPLLCPPITLLLLHSCTFTTGLEQMVSSIVGAESESEEVDACVPFSTPHSLAFGQA